MAGKSWQPCHEPSCGRGSVILIKPEGKGEGRREGQMLVTKHTAKKQKQKKQQQQQQQQQKEC